MKTKKDLRIIKTNNNLYEALLELMKEKSFDNIKITDICDKALVNRSTFYAHYDDKYDLLISGINDLKEKLLYNINDIDNNINAKEYFMNVITIIINHIDENRNVYSLILLNNSNGILMETIYNAIIKEIESKKDIFKTINSDIPFDILYKFYLGAISSIAIEWLKPNNHYSKDEIIKYLYDLMPNL